MEQYFYFTETAADVKLKDKTFVNQAELYVLGENLVKWLKAQE